MASAVRRLSRMLQDGREQRSERYGVRTAERGLQPKR
jgi:hypothetical protein